MNIEAQKGRSITTLCTLLTYSRQAFYQQKIFIEQEALQEDLIIQEVLRIRERQKKSGNQEVVRNAQAIFAWA